MPIFFCTVKSGSTNLLYADKSIETLRCDVVALHVLPASAITSSSVHSHRLVIHYVILHDVPLLPELFVGTEGIDQTFSSNCTLSDFSQLSFGVRFRPGDDQAGFIFNPPGQDKPRSPQLERRVIGGAPEIERRVQIKFFLLLLAVEMEKGGMLS